MLSDIEVVVDSDSDNEPPKKKREIRYTLQSISILNEPLPSPIREDWNSDNESFSFEVGGTSIDTPSVLSSNYDDNFVGMPYDMFSLLTE